MSNNDMNQANKNEEMVFVDEAKNKSRRTIKYVYNKKDDKEQIELGKGSFGYVFKVKKIIIETEKEQAKEYAIKVMNKEEILKKDELSRILTEIKIHRSLQHPNICKFEHAFEDKDNIRIM